MGTKAIDNSLKELVEFAVMTQKCSKPVKEKWGPRPKQEKRKACLTKCLSGRRK
jgi:hypothetical protein